MCDHLHVKKQDSGPSPGKQNYPLDPPSPPSPLKKFFGYRLTPQKIDLPEQVHIQLKLDEKSYRVTAPLIHLSMKISNYGWWIGGGLVNDFIHLYHVFFHNKPGKWAFMAATVQLLTKMPLSKKSGKDLTEAKVCFQWRHFHFWLGLNWTYKTLSKQANCV